MAEVKLCLGDQLERMVKSIDFGEVGELVEASFDNVHLKTDEGESLYFKWEDLKGLCDIWDRQSPMLFLWFKHGANKRRAFVRCAPWVAKVVQELRDELIAERLIDG
jgi:hypothetical protein